MIPAAAARTLMLVALLAAPVAAAQVGGAPTPLDHVTEGVVEAIPATFTVGLQAGLPAYRLGTATFAVRAGGFGAAGRVGYGSVGVVGGAQLRWYPPLPSPAPLYLAGGLDAYAGNVAWHLAIGAQVPLDARWRLDLEGGAAVSSPPLGAGWAPYASLGVSFAVPIAIDLGLEARRAAAERAARIAAATCDAPADPAAVPDGVDAAVRSFLTDAAALHGSSYRSLTYRYRITAVDVQGVEARVSIAYEWSAVEVPSGERVEASGVAHGDLRWTGCVWIVTGVDY